MLLGLQLHGGSVEASCRNLLANCLVSEERIAPLGACSVGFAGLGGSQAQKTGALNAVIVIVIGQKSKEHAKSIKKLCICLKNYDFLIKLHVKFMRNQEYIPIPLQIKILMD